MKHPLYTGCKFKYYKPHKINTTLQILYLLKTFQELGICLLFMSASINFATQTDGLCSRIYQKDLRDRSRY